MQGQQVQVSQKQIEILVDIHASRYIYQQGSFFYLIFKQIFVFPLVKIITQEQSLQICQQQVYKQQICPSIIGLSVANIPVVISGLFLSHIQISCHFFACKIGNMGAIATDVLATDIIVAGLQAASVPAIIGG